MSLLALLRGATLVALVALAVSLWWLAVASGRRLPPAQRTSWVVIAFAYSVLTIDFSLGEVLSLLQRGHGEPGDGVRRLYNSAFLLSAAVDAAFPGILLTVLSSRPRRRHVSLLVVVAIAGVIGWGIQAGALRDWNVLLTVTQVVSFLGIGAYLLFCAFVVLGRLPGVNPYLAGFVAVSAVFHVVLPVQEVIFQLVGRDAAAEIWHLNQFLQLVRMAAQLVIVLLLVNALAKAERPLARAPTGG